jgi:hypothetical protein
MAAGDRRAGEFSAPRLGALAPLAEALLPVRITSAKARNGGIPCARGAARIVRRSPRRRGRLQGAAGGERVDEGALDRLPWRGRASVAAVGRILGGLVVGPENLDIRLRLGGDPVALQAKRME